MPEVERKKRILAIDDEAENLALVREALSSRYDVEVADDPRSGVGKAITGRPDLVILDIDMPGMDGFEVCEAIRSSSRTARTVVIFLTSDPTAETMQRALSVGGSDYLVKPFRLAELLHRIELRLGQAYADEPLRCGNLVLDQTIMGAVINGSTKQVVHLTRKSFAILETLLRNQGRVIGRDQLLPLEVEGTDRAVDLHVCRLRKSLAGWNRRIQAVYGRGYVVR